MQSSFRLIKYPGFRKPSEDSIPKCASQDNIAVQVCLNYILGLHPRGDEYFFTLYCKSGSRYSRYPRHSGLSLCSYLLMSKKKNVLNTDWLTANKHAATTWNDHSLNTHSISCFTSLINFMLHWGGVWDIPHLTGSKFLSHVVYCCSYFYSKYYSSFSVWGGTLSQIYDSILYFMTIKKMLNEGKEQSLIPLLLLWVMRKSLSNVLFLYSTVF